MTVLELGNDDLLVYSPIACDDAVEAQIRALGTVRYVIAPNLIHHLFVSDFMRRFADCQPTLVLAPLLQRRRADLVRDFDAKSYADDARSLADDQSVFAGELFEWPPRACDVALIRGHDFMQEIVLFHEPSKTMLCCDLIESQCYPESPDYQSYFSPYKMLGIVEAPGAPLDLKVGFYGARRLRTLRQCVQRTVYEWDKEMLIPAHGRILDEAFANQIWHDNFAFVLFDI